MTEAPDGYYALSREFLGDDARLVMGFNNYLYHSKDGVSWERLPFEKADVFMGYRDIVYGAGRFVAVGSGSGDAGIQSSSDGVSWSEQSFDFDNVSLSDVVYAKQRFFALSTFTSVLSSSDAVSWQQSVLDTVQFNSVAFGNGQYVLVGNGPIQLSQDGVSWESISLDCTLPNACITNPDGEWLQGPYGPAVFAEGRFYIGAFVSSDGRDWQVYLGLAPEAFVGGYLMARTENGLSASRPDGDVITVPVEPAPSAVTLSQDVEPPSSIEAPLPGGQNCLTHRCFIVGENLYLVP